ncbi:MAG: peptidoglycan DD-metalloendopeptidase family protein [Clostridiales bacterium]|jgi:murein DD-endopeptidase MepM/ murein hydrolase activator NlpD|nr:peptidoglycan DD-metalloendopeptidase family protein [Eubacteriales bacterium]MDH7566983.1 peptidoglycan DD-metalloendopeptidase family protein [Clostridiales bacterium]
MKKKYFLYGLSLTLMLVWTLPAMASPLTDAQKEKSRVDSKINSLSKQKQTATKQKNQLNEKDKALQQAQQEADRQYNQLKNEVNTLTNQIKDIEKALEEAEADYNHQQELFKTRLRVMYENSSNNSYLEALLESKSITDFFNKLQIMSLVSKNDKQMAKELELAKQDVEYKRQMAQAEKQEKQKQADAKKKDIQAITASRASLESQRNALNSVLENLEQQEDALLQQSKELEQTIRNLQKKGTKYAGGIMTWPTPSCTEITSSFGSRYHPILKKTKEHTGIDIGASKGASIVAANKGTVIFAGWNDAYGNAVIIDHGGGITTMYGHCSKLLTSVGSNVEAGDVIAKVGSTGLSTGPHLHFEVRKDGVPVDPMAYFKEQ